MFTNFVFLFLFQKFKGLVRQKTTNSMAMGRALWQKASIKGREWLTRFKFPYKSHQIWSLYSLAGHSVDRKMNGESPSNHHSDFYGGFGQNGGPNHGHGGSAGANGGSSLAGGGGIIPNRQRVFIMDCQVKYTVVSIWYCFFKFISQSPQIRWKFFRLTRRVWGWQMVVIGTNE